MEIYVCVVQLGSFSAAARHHRMTPSAVSKLISRLEARLGTRLINRSTRRLQLTPEGTAFYHRAARILADINEAENAAVAGEIPHGRIRVNTSASYGNHVLAPLVGEFLETYPGVSLDIVHTDQVIDLLAERTDVVVRAGPLKNSTLVARKLGETQMKIVASPAYLARAGIPESIEDLAGHIMIGFGYARAVEGWPLRVDGETVAVPTGGRVLASDGEAVRQLLLGGAGLGRLSEFSVRPDIEAGRLVTVMEGNMMDETEPFYAIHAGQGGPLPSRVRAFLDFLAERGRVS